MTTTLEPADVGQPAARPLAEEARVLGRVVLAGALIGFLVTGLLARLAMAYLATTNPASHGIRSDDGFTIGEFTLGDSLGLAATCAVLGVLSGVIHTALSPLQVGPGWFRTLSISVGGGLVVGAVLVHTDGVDFNFLDPAWLAVALFVLLPIVHVAVLDVVAGRIRRHGPYVSRWPAYLGLVLSVLVAPLTLALGLVRWAILKAGARPGPAAVLASPAWGHLGRAVLTVVFLVAVVDLVGDLRTLY